MMEVGLHPSSTGEPGGKETGSRVSHYVIEGGPFALAFSRLKATGFELRWQSRSDDSERQKKAASKTKYTCPKCGQNAWAKPEASLVCGVCLEEDGAINPMESEV
jgi:ribosomal protein S27AE